eukprot:2548338-Rhodomonas_salina.1
MSRQGMRASRRMQDRNAPLSFRCLPSEPTGNREEKGDATERHGGRGESRTPVLLSEAGKGGGEG